MARDTKETEREQTCRLSRKMMDGEGDRREREKVIEEKEWRRRESELDYTKIGFSFLPP